MPASLKKYLKKMHRTDLIYKWQSNCHINGSSLKAKYNHLYQLGRYIYLSPTSPRNKAKKKQLNKN